MKIVVDTNIIFSGLLSPNGTISDLLLNSSDTFDFYSPTFLVDELDHPTHKPTLHKTQRAIFRHHTMNNNP